MYQPKLNAQLNKDQLHWTLHKSGLSNIFTSVAGGGAGVGTSLYTSVLPLVLDSEQGPHGVLYGHFAAANPHFKALKEAAEQSTTTSTTMITCTLADAYISPNWYPEKFTNGGKAVPTWDYVAVQARGTLTLIEDPEELEEKVLVPLTNKHEQELYKVLTSSNAGSAADAASPLTPTPKTPWKVSDAPRKYVDLMKTQIRGFRFDITKLEGSWKLSQNKTPSTLKSVAEGLEARGTAERAAVVKEGGGCPLAAAVNSQPSVCAAHLRKAAKL